MDLIQEFRFSGGKIITKSTRAKNKNHSGEKLNLKPQQIKNPMKPIFVLDKSLVLNFAANSPNNCRLPPHMHNTIHVRGPPCGTARRSLQTRSSAQYQQPHTTPYKLVLDGKSVDTSR